MFSFPNGSLASAANITAVTNATMRFLLRTPASFTGQVFWNAGGFILSFASGSKIAFETQASGKDADGDIWTIPVSASTLYDFAFTHNFNASSITPTMYLNGVKQTVTRAQTNTGLGALVAAIWSIGLTTGSDYLVGGFGWWSEKLSDENLEKLTRARKHDMPIYISPSTLVQYTPMDDFPVGEFTAASSNITPNADVTNTFLSGGHANIASDDASYLVANASDDNETYTCELTTFTVPAGYSAFATTQSIQGKKGGSPTANASITVNGVEQTVWATAFGSADTTVTRDDYQSLTQANIDGMRLNLKTGTLAKGEDISWDYCFVKISYRKHQVTNLKGSNEFRAVGTTVKSEGYYGAGGY